MSLHQHAVHLISSHLLACCLLPLHGSPLRRGLAAAGVLCSRSGAVRALWGSYSDQVAKQETEWTAGSPTAVWAPWVELLIREHEKQQQEQAPAAAAGAAANGGGGSGGVEEEAPAVLLPSPPVATLDAELEPLLLSKAAQVTCCSRLRPLTYLAQHFCCRLAVCIF